LSTLLANVSDGILIPFGLSKFIESLLGDPEPFIAKCFLLLSNPIQELGVIRGT
jgi:hypothetical protein